MIVLSEYQEARAKEAIELSKNEDGSIKFSVKQFDKLNGKELEAITGDLKPDELEKIKEQLSAQVAIATANYNGLVTLLEDISKM